jgi:hypothetical protein
MSDEELYEKIIKCKKIEKLRNKICRIKLGINLNEPTINGNVYTENMLFNDKTKEKLKRKLLFVSYGENLNSNRLNLKDILGIVKKYEIIGNEIFLSINFLYEHIENTYKNFNITPYGVGIDVYENKVKKIKEYELLGFCIFPKDMKNKFNF